MACMSARWRCRRARAARKCASSRISTGAQEDYLRAARAGRDWGFTILRPVLIVGEAIGGAMNLIPALGVHAAVMRERGPILPYPGGAERVSQAVDADLLARAIALGRRNAGGARRDVQCRPTATCSPGRTSGRRLPMPSACGPGRTSRSCCSRSAGPTGTVRGSATGWRRRAWRSSSGCRWNMPITRCATAYRDRAGRRSFPRSKIMQAGFREVMDTEAMFRKWFRLFQQKRLLPAR